MRESAVFCVIFFRLFFLLSVEAEMKYSNILLNDRKLAGFMLK